MAEMPHDHPHERDDGRGLPRLWGSTRAFGDKPSGAAIVQRLGRMSSSEGEKGAQYQPKALLLVAHGSKKASASSELASLTEKVRRLLPGVEVEAGWLELSRPTVADALGRLAGRGHSSVVAVPLMLVHGHHTTLDIPAELEAACARLGVEVLYTNCLGSRTEVLGLLAARADSAIAAVPSEYLAGGPEGSLRNSSDTGFLAEDLLAGTTPPHGKAGTKGDSHAPKTGTATLSGNKMATAAPEDLRSRWCVLLVGRGTTLGEANAEVAGLARMLYEAYGFGAVEYCFTSLASPTVEEGIERCVKLGYSRIVILPHYLFTGRLLDRVHESVQRARSLLPKHSLVVAEHLGPDPTLASAISELFCEARREAMQSLTQRDGLPRYRGN
jgi:sirohydrochlorin cobaltochelatase